MKQAYLKSGYCYHECSECGVRYTDKEYYSYYSIEKIMRWNINCKKCGAVFTEKPKRCFWKERYGDRHNACSECVEIDGLDYCTRRLRVRREELISWGFYYTCECFNAPETKEYEQLTLF
jgi:hypothetical protein